MENVFRRTKLVSGESYRQEAGNDFEESLLHWHILEAIRLFIAPTQRVNQKKLVGSEQPSHVYRLKKALYGLKQASSSMANNIYRTQLEDDDIGSNDHSFIGIITSSQNPRGIFINQSKYAQEILKKFGFDSCTPIDTPMAERPNLDEDKGGKLIDPTRFRGMVGSLMYLSASRPDIVICCLYVCTIPRLKPTEMHLTAKKRIFAIPKRNHSHGSVDIR
ncbi:retrovirus-related pol polyprotein from transposon TNT 1-94 [Tanacetum coccineum]